MRYISLFSGIEAASVAWEPLGWEPVAFSEIEPFCCDLLAKRFPSVPNLGDVSEIEWSGYAGTVDLIVGGSPCQAFSLAGNRAGLMDDRSRLMLEYIRAVHDVHPRWLLWENVPGVLSQSNGDAFETLQRELEQCGYSLAWRVLDAQFYGVAQRRRRVFVVGHARAGCSAAVLFERENLCWDHPTSRKKREAFTKGIGKGNSSVHSFVDRCGNNWINGKGGFGILMQDDVASTITASFSQNLLIENPPADESICYAVQTGHPGAGGSNIYDNITQTLDCASPPTVVCMAGDTAKAAIDIDAGGRDYIVRRLTPTECERLQGFPDGWTKLDDTTKDAPRYKALGNSMAVPVMRWIGQRIDEIEKI